MSGVQGYTRSIWIAVLWGLGFWTAVVSADLQAQCRPFQVTHVQAPAYARLLDVSDSGSHLLIFSNGDLAATGNSSPATFRYSVQSGTFLLLNSFGSTTSVLDGALSTTGDEYALGVQTTSPFRYVFWRDISGGISRELFDAAGQWDYLRPVISPDGAWLAFQSDDNVAGNGDSNFEVFLYEGQPQNLYQITSSTLPSFSFPLGVTTSGEKVLFLSSRVTAQNSDGGYELWIDDGGVSTQVSVSAAGFGPSTGDINSSGSQAIFVSDGNHAGQNADGNFELFHLNVGTSQITQLTLTAPPAGNDHVAIDSAARFIAWISNFNFSGSNADAFFEVFLVDLVTGKLSQLSNLNSDRTARLPRVASTGLAAFTSNANFFGSNQDLSDEVVLVPCGTSTVFVDGFDRGSATGWTSSALGLLWDPLQLGIE